MSRMRIVTATALALAATLVSTLPAAAAARPPAPRAAAPAASGLVREALAWLAALWEGGPERAATARAETAGGLSPDAGSKALATSLRPAPRPAGGGIDPDGFL
jgi:hypothetical protein